MKTSRLLLAAALFLPVAADASTRRVLVRFQPVAGLESATLQTVRGTVQARGGHVRHSFPELGVLAVEIDSDALPRLSAAHGVVAIEPDPAREVHALRTQQLVPSLDNGLYGLVTARFLEAHGGGQAGAGVLVGVADSGLDCGHPDIAPALLSSVNIVGGGGTGCVGGNGISVAESHATHVAGTIVAAKNKVGMFGGAFGARLLHARVCSGEGRSTCFGSDVMAGVTALIDAGARIVNLSLGGENESTVERSFYSGLASRNVLVVASAGNDARGSLSFPAGYAGVVSVGAVEPSDQPALFSNFGPGLDLVAPGTSVLSSVPRGRGHEATVKVSNRSIFTAIELDGSPTISKNGVRAKLVPCGIGQPEEIPASVKNQIALIERGVLLFAEKAANAMAKGAKGVVIFNNRAGLFAGTLGSATAPNGKPWVPTVGIAQGAGLSLRAFRANKPVHVAGAVSDWDHFDGTSMAAPHVTAAAAILWAARPELNAAGVEQQLKGTALDLGTPGVDAQFGSGRVDAVQALQ
jgi:subtilisin family serine protease